MGTACYPQMLQDYQRYLFICRNGQRCPPHLCFWHWSWLKPPTSCWLWIPFPPSSASRSSDYLVYYVRGSRLAIAILPSCRSHRQDSLPSSRSGSDIDLRGSSILIGHFVEIPAALSLENPCGILLIAVFASLRAASAFPGKWPATRPGMGGVLALREVSISLKAITPGAVDHLDGPKPYKSQCEYCRCKVLRAFA